MYRKAKRRTAVLYIAGTLAIGAAVALIVFIVWILVLRTEYKNCCLEINQKVLAAEPEETFVTLGEETKPLSAEALDYYNQLLLARKVTVYSRKETETTEKSIVLRFSGCTLAFTGLEDGYSIGLTWTTPEETRHYRIRSTEVSFVQMNAYMKGYLKRQ